MKDKDIKKKKHTHTHTPLVTNPGLNVSSIDCLEIWLKFCILQSSKTMQTEQPY